jgi:hypothetical protein
LFPFLKNKEARSSGVVIAARNPQVAESKEESSVSKEACAALIIHAIESKDPKVLMEALQHLFEIMESQPHAEGPHTYESQRK